VFQPNFRGSTGYGTAFERAGDGEWGRKMQSDISDGLAELARQGIADPKRACIVGASYGGYAALAGVTVQHGLYRCAVSIGGVANPNDFLDWIDSRHGHDSMAVNYMKRLLGTDSLDDEKLDPISPVEQAAKADAPILLIYGKDDTVVPTRQSEAMAKALQKAGKPVQVVVLKEEDHWLSREATRVQALTETIAFIEKNNPPN
jgi:dipeptidyl aminopeptidase/acylaminoacyl peptidase